MTYQNAICQSGDQYLASLVVTRTSSLRRFFQRRISECNDVDDMVQDVFLHLARRNNLEQIQNLDGYLFRTASNVLGDRLRYRFSRQTTKHIPLLDEQIEDEGLSPERVLLGREAVGRLEEALLELPERTRLIFFLCRIEGVPYADVCTRLGISLSAVNKHMARANKFLKDHLQEEL